MKIKAIRFLLGMIVSLMTIHMTACTNSKQIEAKRDQKSPPGQVSPTTNPSVISSSLTDLADVYTCDILSEEYYILVGARQSRVGSFDMIVMDDLVSFRGTIFGAHGPDFISIAGAYKINAEKTGKDYLGRGTIVSENNRNSAKLHFFEEMGNPAMFRNGLTNKDNSYKFSGIFQRQSKNYTFACNTPENLPGQLKALQLEQKGMKALLVALNWAVDGAQMSSDTIQYTINKLADVGEVWNEGKIADFEKIRNNSFELFVQASDSISEMIKKGSHYSKVGWEITSEMVEDNVYIPVSEAYEQYLQESGNSPSVMNYHTFVMTVAGDLYVGQLDETAKLLGYSDWLLDKKDSE